MKNWEQFYSKVSLEDIHHNHNVHRMLIDAIESLCPDRKMVLEVGTGSGGLTTKLAQVGFSVISVDASFRILTEARKMMSLLSANASLLRSDGFRLPFGKQVFEMAYSQGFLEHFSDGQIKLLVEQQLKVARFVIFSVPSCHYPKRDLGDERLLSLTRWKRLLTGFPLESLSYYYNDQMLLGILRSP